MKHPCSSPQASSLIDVMHAHLADVLSPYGLPPLCLQRLAAHWQLVCQWNARTNLTAITDPRAAAHHHYLDSLAALGVITAGPVVDLGSGAGFPGLVLAIARPDWRVTLVEPRQKRASFLTIAVARLQLSNVRVLCSRSTDSPDQSYAVAVSRATFSTSSELRGIERWLRPAGMRVLYRSRHGRPYGDSTRFTYDVDGAARVLELWRTAPRPEAIAPRPAAMV